MPRLTESKGRTVTAFVRIPHKREQRLFVCLVLHMFTCFPRKTEHLAEIWHFIRPYYLGAFFYAIVPDVWSGKAQPVLREAGCLFCRTFWNENGSDGCVQPTEMWKN